MSNGRARYGSIFSGAVLILVGLLLLVNAYHPTAEISGLVSRWWPLLLIFWGLVKLYERMAATRGGDPASGNVTGREVILVVCLLLLPGIVGSVDWFRNHRRFLDISDIGFLTGTPYSFTEEIPAKPIPAASHISISLVRGDIDVISEDAAEIRVIAKKTAYANQQNEAQSAAERVHVQIEDKGSGDYDVHPMGGEAGDNRVEVDLKVYVPKQASVAARTERGDLRISGTNGSVSVQVRNGDIDVRNSSGDVSVNSTHGDIHVVGAAGNVKIAGRGSEVDIADVKGQLAVEGEFFGPIRIAHIDKGVRYLSRRSDLTLTQLDGQMDTGSGRLEISNTNGDVTLATRKSDVTIENVSGRIQISDDGGDVELHFSQPPRADISIESRSGELSLALPPQSSFQLDAQTRNGDLDCDFPGPTRLGEGDTDNQALTGQVGSHGPGIRLRTLHGDIRISKKGL